MITEQTRSFVLRNTNLTEVLSGYFFKHPATHTVTTLSKISYQCGSEGETERHAMAVFFSKEKKKKKTSICQSPIEACHCTVHGELHYAISYYGIKKILKWSPGSSKQAESLRLMAVKASGGDSQRLSKSSGSIFWRHQVVMGVRLLRFHSPLVMADRALR